MLVLGALERVVGVVQRELALAAALRVGEHVLDRAPVLARQPRQHRQAFLHPLQRSRAICRVIVVG